MGFRVDEAGHRNGVYLWDAAISFFASPILRWFFTSAIYAERHEQRHQRLHGSHGYPLPASPMVERLARLHHCHGPRRGPSHDRRDRLRGGIYLFPHRSRKYREPALIARDPRVLGWIRVGHDGWSNKWLGWVRIGHARRFGVSDLGKCSQSLGDYFGARDECRPSCEPHHLPHQPSGLGHGRSSTGEVWHVLAGGWPGQPDHRDPGR